MTMHLIKPTRMNIVVLVSDSGVCHQVQGQEQRAASGRVPPAWSLRLQRRLRLERS